MTINLITRCCVVAYQKARETSIILQRIGLIALLRPHKALSPIANQQSKI